MISDVQYTQYEFPIMEIELDTKTDQTQLELLHKHCFAVMPHLHMSNVMLNFRTREVIDQYLGLLSQPMEGVNRIAKLKGADLMYAFEHYPQELKAYSDVLIETTAEELTELLLPRGTHFAPMVQIRFACDPAFEAEMEIFIQNVQNIGPAKCILLEPDYRKEIDFKTYNLVVQCMSSLASTKPMYFERGNFPVSAMRQHPCNAYILSCAHCHSGKKDLPRMYTIQSDGQLYPEGMDQEFPEFAMGNIFEKPLDQLLDTYRLTPNHLRFKEACKRVYHDFVLDYPFSYIPWRYFYVLKAKEIRSEVASQ